jgi:hypothetical protein
MSQCETCNMGAYPGCISGWELPALGLETV